MKITVLLAGALLCVLFIHSAEARPRHTSPHQVEVGCSDPVMRPCYPGGAATSGRGRVVLKRHERRANLALARRASEASMPPGLPRVMAEGAGRAVNWIKPRAWCGWFMRHEFGVANPAANVARWWAGYGRPAHGPHVGAIVVWRHHVGRITGRTADGRWIVKSGNDGHLVRERPRSVAGAIAFRWPA